MSEQNGQITSADNAQLQVPNNNDLRITSQDINNLEAVFTNARANSVGNEQQLIDIINFKSIFMQKIANIMNGYSEEDKNKESGNDSSGFHDGDNQE